MDCRATPQVNLTWLDLSFNQISVIEGLETLTKLQDLSLFNNNISVIGGLDSMTMLNVLSIGAHAQVAVCASRFASAAASWYPHKLAQGMMLYHCQ